MIIDSLKLINYRNYKKLNINFDNGLNILIGNNAQGKTNILEAIYVLGITKSHLNVNDNNLINSECTNSKIEGVIRTSEIKKNLEVIITNDSKKVKINKKEIKKISEYISKLNVILFSPNDLKLIKNGPMVRRRFLNVEISQLYNNYIKLMNDYNVILKTRNDILKKIKLKQKFDKVYLEILNKKYVDLATEIYVIRKKFIDNLNDRIKDIYLNIMGGDNFLIKYVTSINIDGNTEDIRDNLNKKLESSLDKEVVYGSSLYGPHRDDLLFYLDDKDLSLYGSQGQQRVAILSLKLAEIDLFKEVTNDNPIILLDDIFSELDNNKQNKLIKYINNGIQVIITTTDLNKINKKLINGSKIYNVIDGKVEEINSGK